MRDGGRVSVGHARVEDNATTGPAFAGAFWPEGDNLRYSAEPATTAPALTIDEMG